MKNKIRKGIIYNNKFIYLKYIILLLSFIFIFFFIKNYKANNYILYKSLNRENLKTFSFQRVNQFNKNINNKLNYNLTFFSENNEDSFRVEKLQKMGLSRFKKLDIYNLYILPYIMGDELKSKISKYIKNKYQKINMFFNYKDYCSKSLLYFNYEKMKEIFPFEYNYMLETYSYPENKEIIIKKFSNYSYINSSKDNFWLLKPKFSLAGKGIIILKNISNINENYLITKYLNNPHLIKGVKYDLRYHGLITSIKPLKLYLYNEGLTRLATEKYNYYNHTNIYSFLTNLHINMYNKKKFIYPKNITNIEDSHLWNLETLKNYFLKNGINYDKIYEEVKDIFIKMIFSVRKKIIKNIKEYKLANSNFYHLIGFDIILDENLKPYLLEANRKAGFRDDNDAEKNFTHNLIIDTINLVGLKNIQKNNIRKYTNIKEIIEDNICELNRPRGGYNLIFPLKNNIEKYKSFYLNDIPKEDLKLWKYLKE